MTIVFVVVGTLVGAVLLWPACSRLEDSTQRLAQHYGIPDAVKGSMSRTESSLWNVLGSNVFDLLVAVPLTIRESHVMLLLYLGFGLCMTLEAFGVTSVLGVRGGP